MEKLELEILSIHIGLGLIYKIYILQVLRQFQPNK